MPNEILHGIHSVREAVLAQRRRIHEIRMTGRRLSARHEEVETLAKSRNVPVVFEPRPREGFKAASGEEHQDIIARVSSYPTMELADILEAFPMAEKALFFLILDQIVDPQNLGALIRTALCAGIDAVILSKDRSAGPTPAVSRASAGALEHIRLAVVTNISETIRRLQQQGVWISGLDIHGGQSLFDADFTSHTALVVGSEGRGIRSLVKRSCDFLISLPQQGPVASLNASAAGAVAMYEVFRQRKAHEKEEL